MSRVEPTSTLGGGLVGERSGRGAHVHESQETQATRLSTWETGSLPRCCQAWIAEQSRSWALTRSSGKRN
jgi:hypothetical protein